jgi:hypothetical protein
MQSAANLVYTVRHQAMREAEHRNIKKQVAGATYTSFSKCKTRCSGCGDCRTPISEQNRRAANTFAWKYEPSI